MLITQGQRLPVNSLICGTSLRLAFEIATPQIIDFVCFGVDAQGRLSDDRYMIFFNQPLSPCGSIKLTAANQFDIDLATLPGTIERMVFTASIDGAGGMCDIGPSRFCVLEQGGERARGEFCGASFAAEKAIMVVELYRRNAEWRLSSVLQGFNEGLAALVRHFGGTVAEDLPAAVPAPASARVCLEKKIAGAAPHLVSLARKAAISLEKARLGDVVARVAAVFDGSGSMNGQYRRGRVQEVVNRIVPLAVHFDDDASIDCWAFGDKPQQLSPIDLDNHRDYIDSDHGGWKNWSLGSRINNEAAVMEKVIDFYRKSGERTPVYVLFISDGGIHSGTSKRIIKLMTDAARLPIFWQFIGLGGSNYGVLERLDDMSGRIVDNCGFFALDDLHDLSEEQLYDRLMEEFPAWLKAARQARIID